MLSRVFKLYFGLFLTFLLLIAGKKKAPPATPYITSFRPGAHYVVLTFENGPHATITPLLLDILASYQVHATFFVNGLKASYHPHLIVRMLDEGHDIANYGLYDKKVAKSSVDSFPMKIESLNYTSNIIHHLTNKRPRFFRPLSIAKNYLDNPLLEQIRDTLQLTTVWYSIDLTSPKSKYSQNLTETVNNVCRVGDVLAMEDSSKYTLSTLPTLIELLHNQSFEILTLAQITSFPDDSSH